MMKKKMSETERRAFVEEFAITTAALAIAKAIKETGISQREIADRLGVSEARISQVVNGTGTGNPTVRSLARLADVLGRELRVEFAEESHVPDHGTEWQQSEGIWTEVANDEDEKSEQGVTRAGGPVSDITEAGVVPAGARDARAGARKLPSSLRGRRRRAL